MNDSEHWKSSTYVYIKFVNMFLLSHFIDQTREFAHYQYYYTHRWSRLMHNREQNEIIRTRSFFRCQKFEYATLLRRSFEHEIFFLVLLKIHSSTSYLLFDAYHIKRFDFCMSAWSHRNDLIWKIIIVVIFAFDRLELFDLFAEIVATTSDWRLLLKSFSQWFSDQIVWTNRSHHRIFAAETKRLRFSMILWS